MTYHQRLTIWKKAQNLIEEHQFQECASLFLQAYQNHPEHDWYALFAGDIYRYHLTQEDDALHLYEKPLLEGRNRLNSSTLSPLRYLLKRVSNMYYEKQNWEKAATYFEWFMSFQPSNFHDKEFVRYATALMQMNKQGKALEILALGLKYSHSREIKKMWNQISENRVEIIPFNPIRNSYERIPVKTDLIMKGDNIAEKVDTYTRNLRKKGDILTIASCVVAVTEGRMHSVDSIRASHFAKFLSRFVHDDQFPFGGNAPLCNPLSMQAAIQEAGFLRILLAALFGGLISKLVPGSGMFYRLAGEQAALIDDMPGAIPPYDYYVVLGPENSKSTCLEITQRSGHESAVIDANDLQIAWAVACSDDKLKKPVEQALSDNPAGNGDQKTPIVILRPVP